MDLSDLIARNAAFTPDKAATVFDNETLSYAAFHARIERAALPGHNLRWCHPRDRRDIVQIPRAIDSVDLDGACRSVYR